MARRLLICLALVGATLVPYAQTLRFDFVSWDDPVYISNNPIVREGLTVRGAVWAVVTGETANWHPLVTLSHMLDCDLYGLSPGGHHATNVALHVANTLVLFAVLESMTAALWPSAWVAALFALHPLHVEPVAWVSARKDVLSTFFGFLSLWAWAAYARRGGGGRYLLTALLFACALMAKPMLVTLPVVLLLLDYWPLDRLRLGWRRLVLEKVPLFALSAASVLVTFAVHVRAGGVAEITPVSFWPRAANAVMSYVRYLGKLVWPTDFSVLYPHPNLPGGTPWTSWQIAGAAGLLLAISALVLVSRRRWAIVGWLWYLIGVLPASGLVPSGFEAMADRFTYVPLVGVLIVIAWGGAELAARWRLARPAVAVGALVSVAIVTVASWSQARYWRDSVTLYEHSLAVAPDPPVLHYNLANVLDARGDRLAALRHYREAVRIDPRYAEAFNNLGVTLFELGRTDDAIAQYREAVRLKPENARAHNNLGRALETQQRLEEAIGHYREAVRIDAEYGMGHFNLARTLQARGELDQAIAHYRDAVRLRPDLTPAQSGLASALRARARSEGQ